MLNCQSSTPMRHLIFVAGLICGLIASSLIQAQPCRINVVEQGSGWPVPLVELRTTHQVRLVSDNAGCIAFDLPELMGPRDLV